MGEGRVYKIGQIYTFTVVKRDNRQATAPARSRFLKSRTHKASHRRDMDGDSMNRHTRYGEYTTLFQL
ncbi:hypothetical protein GCM10025857_31630 [Alicyclobacillus contaminans]|nr:hypothetical protein GCM10025857_31630 [Alicyclobacillus contaminans]